MRSRRTWQRFSRAHPKITSISNWEYDCATQSTPWALARFEQVDWEVFRPQTVSATIFEKSESATQTYRLRHRWRLIAMTTQYRFDPALAAALVLASLFCFHGITWGRVECWNRDQMAMRNLAGLRPGDYGKPPFHTYLNHILVIEPIKLPLRLAHVPQEKRNRVNGAMLLGSRLLVLALYLGTILLGYTISLRCYGRVAAQIIALLFATSAGFIAFAHFLTADSPLLFWMMAAFFFGHRIAFEGKTSDYVWCGFLTGIATATKYNGLAAGLVLVAAHFLRLKGSRWQELFFSRQLALGLFMIPIGFITGNSYGVLRDWNRFRTDFLFNYIVTPRYEGQPDRFGYLSFLQRIPEIIGRPGVAAILVCIFIATIVVLRKRDLSDNATRGFILASTLFLFYFFKNGRVSSSAYAFRPACYSISSSRDRAGLSKGRTQELVMRPSCAGLDLQLHLQLLRRPAF
jgi:hypothetical protein